MATPLNLQTQQILDPKTLIGVQPVTLALVEYVDDTGTKITQFAVVGENNVHLLEARDMGLSKNTTPKGKASQWLASKILKIFKDKADKKGKK